MRLIDAVEVHDCTIATGVEEELCKIIVNLTRSRYFVDVASLSSGLTLSV